MWVVIQKKKTDMNVTHYGGQGWTLQSSSWCRGWSSESQRSEVTVAWESFSTHPQRALRLPGNKQLLGYISQHRNKHPPYISDSLIQNLHLWIVNVFTYQCRRWCCTLCVHYWTTRRKAAALASRWALRWPGRAAVPPWWRRDGPCQSRATGRQSKLEKEWKATAKAQVTQTSGGNLQRQLVL